MIQVKAYAAQAAKQPLAPFQIQRREPGPNDVLIGIKYCGVCHSDIHQVRDEWGGAQFPMIPGHEIVGVITQVGSQVTRFKVGDFAGVGCFVDSCRECSSCREGLEQYCEVGANFTYNGVEKDQKTRTQGGYSTQIVVDERYTLKIPENLPLDASAPLLCAGITLYSPLRHWKAGPGKKVAILGLGGLGHMGVKLARAMGAEVTVLSHSRNKEADAKRLGAHHFYSTSDSETFKLLESSFDLVLNTVSAALDWDQYVNLLKRDGTFVLLGIPDRQVPLAAFSLVGGRRSLAGSLIGGIAETQEMLDFCGLHEIVSDIELIPMNQINEAYERVIRSEVRYRFVIDMGSLR